MDEAESLEKQSQSSAAEQDQIFCSIRFTIVAGKEESGKVGRMVRVKVGEDNHVDVIDGYAEFKETAHHGRTGINQDVAPGCAEKIGGG